MCLILGLFPQVHISIPSIFIPFVNGDQYTSIYNMVIVVKRINLFDHPTISAVLIIIHY